jgi:O-antigen/teichoic acid export membrane protein
MAEKQSGGTLANAGLLSSVNLILVSNIAVSACGFLIAIAIARSLGPEGRGITSLFQNATGLGFALVSLGVSVGILYFVSKNEVSPRQALEAGLSITVLSAIVVAAAVGIGALAFGEQLRRSGIPYWLLIAAVPIVVQFRVVESVLRCQGRFLVVSVLEVLAPLTVLVSLLTLESFGALTTARAVMAWTAGQGLPLLWGYAFVGPRDWPRRLAGKALLRKLLGFGLLGQMGNVVQLLNYRLDSYLVLLFVDTRGVGLYAIGVALSEALWLLANSVAVVLVPRLTAADEEYVSRTTPLVCRGTVLASLAGAVVLGIAAPRLIPLLFGDDFRGSVAPLLWLLPGTVALAASKVLSAYVFSRGRPLINTSIAGLTFAATMAGDLALIPTLGVDGAAIASSLAYILSLGLTAAAYRRLSGRPVSEVLVPRIADLRLYLDAAKLLLGRSRALRGAITPP